VRKVTAGPGDANNVTITAGLKPGDSVVVDGADRLKDGAKVLVRQGGAARPVAGAAADAGSDTRTPASGQRRQDGRRRSQPGNTGGT
jgi:multidrug efflux system membrane fusion protein